MMDVKSQIKQLLMITDMCKEHKASADSYTAPGYIDYLGRLLHLSDIPMNSDKTLINTETAKDPSKVPWEDSIKNLILDVFSVTTESKFSRCILLFDIGYEFEDITVSLISRRYIKNNGVILCIVPISEDYETFSINIYCNGKSENKIEVIANDLISEITLWYRQYETLVMCHDSTLPLYTNAIELMPYSMFSMSCTSHTFISPPNSRERNFEYVCPIYSHPLSTETRLVCTGPIAFRKHKLLNSYIGQMNYYIKSIRRSKLSSGKCYDCGMLEKLLSPYLDKIEKNNILQEIVFTQEFLDDSTTIEN